MVQKKKTFCLFCDKKGIFVSLQSWKYYQQNKITPVENESTLLSCKSTPHDAYTHVSTSQGDRSAVKK